MQQVQELAIHAEGSLEAEKMQIFRACNQNGGARCRR